MHRGWFKCWRKITDSAVWRKPELLKVWLWCLSEAAWEPKTAKLLIGRDLVVVDLEPGQFVFGRHTAAAALQMKSSSVRNRMEKLKNLGNLDIQPDKHYSLVTICNWEIYAADDEQNGQPTGQAEDKHRTSIGQAKDTTKKVKKVKKDKNIQGRFVPPIVAEVAAYCSERGNGINPQDFIDYYEARGWQYRNGQPVKCWQAAIRTWEARQKERTNGSQARPGSIVRRRSAARTIGWEPGDEGNLPLGLDDGTVPPKPS